jgi:hypothetical protein
MKRRLFIFRATARALAILILVASSAGAQDADGISAVFEPYLGVLTWSDETLDDERLIGLRAGVNAPNGVGVFGFYGEGTDGLFRDEGRLRAYGGGLEARLLRFDAVAPFVQGGLGRLDRDDATPAADQDLVFAGAGVGVRISELIALKLGVQDYVTNLSFDRIGDTRVDDLVHNLLYTAGLSFEFGRRRPPSRRPVLGMPVTAADPGRVARAAEPIDAPATVIDQRSDTLVTIPVPREGELYVRYGPDRAASWLDDRRAMPVDDEDLRRMVREEVARALAVAAIGPSQSIAAGQGMLTQAQLDSLEARIANRVAVALTTVVEERLASQVGAIVTRAVREESEVTRRTLADQLARDLTVIDRPVATPAVAAAVSDAESPRRWVVTAVVPYVGASFGPGQALLGVRVDLGALATSLPPLRVTPEVALGAGPEGVSLLAAGHLTYGFGTVRLGGARALPHIGIGLGVLIGGDATEGVLNFGYGTQLELSPRSWLSIGPDTRLFIEHQGIDLYRQHRILVGLRRGW